MAEVSSEVIRNTVLIYDDRIWLHIWEPVQHDHQNRVVFLDTLQIKFTKGSLTLNIVMVFLQNFQQDKPRHTRHIFPLLSPHVLPKDNGGLQAEKPTRGNRYLR